MAKNFPYKWIRINGVDILEHRYIMENIIGRKLTYNEVVHHYNGNTLDNRLENLRLEKRNEHTKKHREQQAIKVIMECPECKKEIIITLAKYRYYKKIGQRLFCSRKCIYPFYKKIKNVS